MPSLLEYQMVAFHDELSKEAFNVAGAAGAVRKAVGNPAIRSGMTRALGGAGSGAGMGGLAGAVGGATISGGRSYVDQRRQGNSVAGSLGSSLGAAGKGALTGAAVGATAGGLGVGALRASGRTVPGGVSSLPGMASASRFGQRQVHSLTGWTPKGYGNVAGIRQIRGGGFDAAKKVKDTASALKKAPGDAKAVKANAAARKHLGAAQKAEKMGLTSLPGYAKAMAKNPSEALKAGFGEQWHSMGTGGKALMFGLPAGLAAKEMATKTEEGGPGKVERVGKALGTLAYGAGPLALAGSTALGMGADAGMSGAGKLMRRRKPGYAVPAAELESAGGSAVPSERQYSERATGQSEGYGG